MMPPPPPRPAATAPPPALPERVRQSEVLSALSHALDLTEGQPVGHTLRSCAIGMRLAGELGLGTEERAALYYALLLKDAGCSSNAARMAAVFGSDDRAVKFGMKLVDWNHRLPLAIATARMTGIGQSLLSRCRHFLGVARTDDLTRQLIEIRCDRGAQIIRELGFPAATAEAVRRLDEHWDGRGYPDGWRGEQIPLLARIASLAQTVEVFHAARGAAGAVAVARQRRGTWFDPRLVNRLVGWEGDAEWWARLRSPELDRWVVESEPGDSPLPADDLALDRVARAFADIIDAKSPYTYRHSRNVAEFARGMAGVMGMGPTEARLLYRAGLLHDIGKLGVSSRILDKPGRLTPEEREQIEQHPVYSWQILSRVQAFSGFARVAALHHEKLDGSGYPWKLTEEHLSPAARVLCVADIYEALTADRPYRAGLAPSEALEILRRDAGTRLCAAAIYGLEALLAGGFRPGEAQE